MRVLIRSALAMTALAAVAALVPTPAVAGGVVPILILKEHGIGGAAQAQPYVDKLMAVAAAENGWGSANGKYVTTRSAADAFIASDNPHYAILSLAPFLAYKTKHNLDVIGQVNASTAGGIQYHLISKSASDLAGCKGKALATNHGDDTKFINKVVFNGAFSLSDFTLVATTRPIQTINKVVDGSAECALIDDAQFAQLASLSQAAGVKSVWKSDKLPPMVIVAFPSAPAAERTAFQASMPKMCAGANAEVCKGAGLQSLATASNGAYAAVVTAYNK